MREEERKQACDSCNACCAQVAFSTVGGQYVPDFLFQDDFCPLWPAGQAQCQLTGLLRGWHADASGALLTAVLQALVARLAVVQP